MDRRTNALQTNRQTDQPTDTASYRGALSHLKTHKKLVTSKRQKLDLMPSNRIQHHKPFRFYSGKNNKAHLDLQGTI